MNILYTVCSPVAIYFPHFKPPGKETLIKKTFQFD